MTVPSRLQDARRFLDTIDLRRLESDIADEARAQLVIIGPVNSGKSTLFNQLKGRKLSNVSAVPGTTREVISEQFGPFWLVDTPGLGEVSGSQTTATALGAIQHASVAVLVLDASAGVRQSDADLYQQVLAMGIPVVIALNKIDLIQRDAQRVVADVERKLRTPVIPISAKNGSGLADRLLPAIIEAHPRMAVTIGRALPRYRQIAARRVIRESAWVAAVMSAEPIPGLEIPFLIAVQVRMLLRLSAIYGQVMGVARARELLSAIAGGVAIRYAVQELVKLIPGPGWLVAGATAWTGTTALGSAAVAFFQSSGRLTTDELRDLYRRFRKKGAAPPAELAGDDD
jgi:small GTP-binding protein